MNFLTTVAGIIVSSMWLLAASALIYAFWDVIHNKIIKQCGVGFVLFMAVMILYGGSKTFFSHTSTDEGIELLDFTAEPIEQILNEGTVTNIIGVTYIFSVAPTSDPPKPVWWRDAQSDEWTNFAQTNGWTTAEPYLDSTSSLTNVYKWTNNSITNEFDHRFWYIGVDLPNVIIDVDDDDIIQITEWAITAKDVKIKFTVADTFQYPEGTVIQIQRADLGTNSNRRGALRASNYNYETIDTIPVATGGLYTWKGFEVGRNTAWRLRITILED